MPEATARARREAIADAVRRRWREHEARLGQGRLARRDAEAREILDGDAAAFAHVRARRGVDQPEAQRRIVAGIERVIARTMTWRPMVALVERALARRPDAGGPRRVLELAAGTGWLSERIGHALVRRVPQLEIWASDLNPRFLAPMRERLGRAGVRAPVLALDARDLEALRPGSFDVAVLSLTLHHLAPKDAAVCLAEMDRVSAGGTVVVDVTRSRWAAFVNEAVYPLLAPSAVPWLIEDGRTSIRRAYDHRELALLLECAGLRERYRVGRLPGFHPARSLLQAIWPR